MRRRGSGAASLRFQKPKCSLWDWASRAFSKGMQRLRVEGLGCRVSHFARMPKWTEALPSHQCFQCVYCVSLSGMEL